MNHRFNSTGRLRITRDKFEIRVIDDGLGGAAKFTADLAGLTTLGLDPEARVIVEPYVKASSSMRFDFGVVGNITPPSGLVLAEIDRNAAVQFRIKVVDTKGRVGRLLAMADRVRPSDENEDDSHKSILPVRQIDLGESIWRLEVSTEESPVLVINRRVPDLMNRLLEDPVVQGAIFVPAIREVVRVLLTEEVSADQSWVTDWREFVEAILGEPLPDDEMEEDDLKDFLDRVIESFSNRERWATAAQPSGELMDIDYE